MSLKYLLALSFGLVTAAATAAVRVPALVGDHMVLQRDQLLTIWGWAEPGEKVTVDFQRRSSSLVTPASGKWQVTLPAASSGGPFVMTIKGQNTLTISDIMVGDVWLASGQSNMELPLRDPNAPKPGCCRSAYGLGRCLAHEQLAKQAAGHNTREMCNWEHGGKLFHRKQGVPARPQRFACSDC